MTYSKNDSVVVTSGIHSGRLAWFHKLSGRGGKGEYCFIYFQGTVNMSGAQVKVSEIAPFVEPDRIELLKSMVKHEGCMRAYFAAKKASPFDGVVKLDYRSDSPIRFNVLHSKDDDIKDSFVADCPFGAYNAIVDYLGADYRLISYEVL